MKAAIIDGDALRAVSPASITAYARMAGWERAERFGDHSDVYVRAGQPDLIIPGTDALGDYAAVIAGLLRVLASVEDRDELSVYRDLVGADRDVIRIRAPRAENDGSVKIDDGVDLIREARDLLLAAACAATEPRASYSAGKIKEAGFYMERVRLGQTEHGSFVATLLAPVPPALDQGQTHFWPQLAEEPFERLVTRRLMDGLFAAQAAAESAVRSDAGMTAFQRAVHYGVSANLCEALAGLIERGDGLTVSVTWARTRPAPEPRRRIEYSRFEGEVFREAARLFRQQEPRPDEQLEAYVIAADRGVEQEQGSVTLKTFLDGKAVSVRARLSSVDYSVALEAHNRKDGITVTGDLVRHGQRWFLENPRNLAVLPREANDDAEEVP